MKTKLILLVSFVVFAIFALLSYTIYSNHILRKDNIQLQNIMVNNIAVIRQQLKNLKTRSEIHRDIIQSNMDMIKDLEYKTNILRKNMYSHLKK